MTTPATVLLPLYSWPTLPPWSFLTSSIESNPNLNFTVIVNPDSGPGNSQYPSLDYIAGLAQLHNYPNAKLYGYVHTAWGHNSLVDVKLNITKYSGWKDYESVDIHGMLSCTTSTHKVITLNIKVDGIFFDEAPKIYSEESFNYMSALSNFSHSSQLNKIVFNPGVVPDSRYFALADTIVVFESPYTKYSTTVLDSIPNMLLWQSALLILDFAGTTGDQDTIIEDLQSKGIQGLFISTKSSYDEVSTLWSDFCEYMNPETSSQACF